ncbi:MAG: hypothetical protein Q9157_005075 [Trypethelium eluteriae]
MRFTSQITLVLVAAATTIVGAPLSSLPGSLTGRAPPSLDSEIIEDSSSSSKRAAPSLDFELSEDSASSSKRTAPSLDYEISEDSSSSSKRAAPNLDSEIHEDSASSSKRDALNFNYEINEDKASNLERAAPSLDKEIHEDSASSSKHAVPAAESNSPDSTLPPVLIVPLDSRDPRVSQIVMALSIEQTAEEGYHNALAYEKYRPSYPSETINLLTELLHKKSESHYRIVDLAAGTGKFTELLAMPLAGRQIIAVEPHPQMRQILASKELEGVCTTDGTAAQMKDVATGWADAVVVAQPATKWETQVRDLAWSLDDKVHSFRRPRWMAVFGEHQETGEIIDSPKQDLFAVPLQRRAVMKTEWLEKMTIWARFSTLSFVATLGEDELQNAKRRVEEILEGEDVELNDKGEVAVHISTQMTSVLDAMRKAQLGETWAKEKAIAERERTGVLTFEKKLTGLPDLWIDQNRSLSNAANDSYLSTSST